MSIVIGDIHGKFKELYNKLEKNKELYSKMDLFVLGDMNVGFYPDFEKQHLWPKLNRFLDSISSVLYIVRGNHDNPYWFDGRHDYKRIKFLRDYSIIKTKDIEGNSINALILGGSISINRTSKKFISGKNWFPEESFVFDEKALKEARNIDIVLSHNCPLFCPSSGINTLILEWAERDPKLPDDIINEQQLISNAYQILKKNNPLYKWYYGHIHNASIFYYENTEFVCLEELEFKEITYRSFFVNYYKNKEIIQYLNI